MGLHILQLVHILLLCHKRIRYKETYGILYKIILYSYMCIMISKTRVNEFL